MNGTLLIAGGNIGATEQGKADIFGRFSALCGGKRGKVMLAVCASGEAEESFRFNRELLLSAGIGEVVLLPLTEDPALLGRSGWTNRADEALLPLFDGVSGVWFSGGDQLHTARLLLQPDGSDTPVLGRMRRLLSGGGVIGGSSADAAAYCDNGGVSPEQLLLSRGLGFLPGGIVDQHFNRRARLQRLLAAMEDADENEGFGISEDTALEVSLSDGALRVHGSAYVMHLTRTGGTITINKLTAAQHAVQ